MEDEYKIGKIRMERERAFQEFDAKIIQFLSNGETIPDEWKLYGQSLRDMTKDLDTVSINPNTRTIEVKLPTKPE
ncbi:uncharacterized protein METZ01_LOCUS180738 [marine metagenome]|uniref:Uncharacterized protein n=1 Tax=marine metagenome TaxID=408172 RepID=A0A382CPY7_9ZZZZ